MRRVPPVAVPWVLAVLYGLILVLLAARAPLRTIGDGGEYLAYALAMSHGDSPALTTDSITRVRAAIAPFDPDHAAWPMEEAGRRSPDGRLHFAHFWLYPALAAPFVAVARGLDADPRRGFVALNILLLAAAAGAVCARLGPWLAVFLFAGPIVWWSDKVHPEAFIVSLMAIALTVWRERPGLAMLCAALVGAQVPPFALFVPLLAAAAVMDRRDRWHRRSFQLALVGASALVAFPAVYYLTRFGSPSPLADLAQRRWPSISELGLVLWDLNIGLFPSWPLLAVALVVALTAILGLLRPARPGGSPEGLRYTLGREGTPSAGARPAAEDARLGDRLGVAMTLIGGFTLLVAFTQIGNPMHGATPGIIRYAIWIVPLTLPVFAAAHPGGRRAIATIAVLSVAVSLYRYAPAVAEFAHRPTSLALWVWRQVPSLSHPLPEVFTRSLDPRGTAVPIAAPGCRKILLVGRGESQGMWPRPCPPGDVPGECREPGVLCYANRAGRTYRFRRLTQPLDWLKYDPSSVWSRRAETSLRIAMAHDDWWSMRPLSRRTAHGPVSALSDVVADEVFGAEGRYLWILSSAGSGARIDLREEGVPVHVVLVDGETGRSVPAALTDAAASGTRVLSLPPTPGMLILLLSADRR